MESANSKVMRNLPTLIYDIRLVTIWSDMLPLVQRIMNSKPVESIGFSPAHIVFGNAIDLDRHLIPGNIRDQASDSEGSYMRWIDDLIQRQAEIIAIAQEHLESRDVEQLSKRRRAHGDVTKFPIGSIVLASYPPPSKLHPKC